MNYLEIKAGAISGVKDALSSADISGKVLYVYDKVVDNLYGKTVRDQIEAICRIKEECVEENTIEYAMNISERIIATDIKCIVGMGGGKVLDVCKYAAYITKIPYLSIPTTAANDGMASPIAVLKRQDKKPKSLGAAMPSMILVDVDIIAKSPPVLIKAGIGDTMSNYMALLDWDLACRRGKDRPNGFARLMSQNAIDVLLHSSYDHICPDFIKVLVNSLVLSGIAMNYAGSSRPVSGSEHLFSHALDYYGGKNNLHGLQTALGTVAVLELIGQDSSMVADYFKRFDVDINPKRLEIDKKTFVFCMQKATTMRDNRYTYLHETNLEDGRLGELYDKLTENL